MKKLMYQYPSGTEFVLLQSIDERNIAEWNCKSLRGDGNDGVFWVAGVIEGTAEYPTKLHIPSIYKSPNLIANNRGMWVFDTQARVERIVGK